MRKYKLLLIIISFIFMVGFKSNGMENDELNQMITVTQEVLKNKDFEYIEQYALKNKFKRIEIAYNNGMTGKIKIIEKNKINNSNENSDKRKDFKNVYKAIKDLKKEYPTVVDIILVNQNEKKSIFF